MARRNIAYRDPTGDRAAANADKQKKNPRRSGNSSEGQGNYLTAGANSKGSRPR